MSNNVTYTIALTPENAPKIDAVNRILLGEDYVTSATAGAGTATATKPAKPEHKAPTKPTKTSDVSLDEFKKAAKAVKRKHGEEFANEVLEAAGVEMGASLGRTVSNVDPDLYKAIIDAWEEGPQANTENDGLDDDDDLDDDDGLGDDGDDGDDSVDPEAVKTALKAYAKDNGRDAAKAMMEKYGASALSKVDGLPQAKLAKLFAELV